MIRLDSYAGRHVAVFGLGGSGRVAARALILGGARVSAWDDSRPAREAALSDQIPIVDLRDADWSQFHSLVVAPGVPLTHPEPHWSVVCARDAGCRVIGDVELFCVERAACCPDAPFVAITGTNGKSTTTALIAHLLRSVGCDVEMGGNIGKAILSLAPPSRSRIHVIEMSSYQIDLTPSLKPTVGVLLNVSPDHLDRHGTLEHYARVKERLVAVSESAVVGVDDTWTAAVAERLSERGDCYPFTIGTGSGIVPKFYAIGNSLFMHESGNGCASSTEIASLENAVALRGSHNVQNALGALGAIKALQDRFDASGEGAPSKVWDISRLREGLMNFPGLAHRLEPVGCVGDVSFINDSKATNAVSVQKALGAWGEGIFWIVGGQAKAGGIDELEPWFSSVERAFLIGEASSSFAKVLDGKVEFSMCETLDAAVAQAAAAAVSYARSHEGEDAVVLLSPACASFDQFKNFEARGEAFRALVGELPGAVMRGDA